MESSSRLLAGLGAADSHEAFQVFAKHRSSGERRRQPPKLSLAVGIQLADQAVVNPGPLPPVFNDAGRAEGGEMTRYLGLRELQRFLEMANTQLAMRKQRNDAKPGLVAERLE